MMMAAFLRLIALLPPLAATFTPTATLPPILPPGATAATWPTQRAELSRLVQQHILGFLPAETPTILNATVVNITTTASLTSMYARLAFRANATVVAFDVWIAWQPTALNVPRPLMLTPVRTRACCEKLNEGARAASCAARVLRREHERACILTEVQ